MAAVKNFASRNANVIRRALDAGDYNFAAVIFSAEFINGENLDEQEAAQIWETWLPDRTEEKYEVFGYICW